MRDAGAHMHLTEYSDRVLSLAQAIYRWLGALSGLDEARRIKLAGYADEIAATLARAADTMVRLDLDPRDAAARRQMVREFGRIGGYVETMAAALRHELDGRKLAGVKRRLEQLSAGVRLDRKDGGPDAAGIERIIAAEGFFKALADGLRA